MAIVRINNIGRVGVIADIPPHELPLEAWSVALNVRFVDGKAEKFAGETAIYGTPSTEPHWLLPWETTAGYRWIYAGVTGVYYVVSSGTSTNITRGTVTIGDTPYAAGARPVWTGGILHGIPILNNDGGVDPPQSWDGTDRLQNLPNWPASTYCKIMRIYGNFLVALDITDGSGNSPYTVKWSHPADPGTVPASWDPSDATKLAGEKTLSDTTGFLVDCLPLLSQNIVYKTDSIYTMRLTTSQLVFGFQQVSNTIGALNTNCVREFFGHHFVVGETDIVLFNGQTVRSIISSRNRKLFFDSLDPTYWDKTYVTVNLPAQEVWVFFVKVNSLWNYPDSALVWNWSEDTWTLRSVPDLAYSDFGRTNQATGQTFNSSSGTFDSDFGIFDFSSGSSPANQSLLHARATPTAAFFRGDDSFTSNGTAFTSILERTGLAIAGTDRQGNPKVDPASIKFVRSVFPKISAPTNTTLQISIGMQATLGGPVTWEGPYDFVVNVDTRIDTALQGRFFAIKIEDSGSLPWQFTGYELDLDVISVN